MRISLHILYRNPIGKYRELTVQKRRRSSDAAPPPSVCALQTKLNYRVQWYPPAPSRKGWSSGSIHERKATRWQEICKPDLTDVFRA